jgi:hypothetical protein
LENLIFMIIIGIFSVIVGKSKIKQGQPKNNPFSKKAFEEIRTQVNKQVSYVEKRKTSPIKKERNAAMTLNNLENLENKYQQLKQESDVSRIGMTVSQAQQTVNKAEVKTEALDSLYSLNPDEKTLINGIIWSEILGEPRSKNPYLPRKG